VIVIRGHLGFGDCIHQRAIMRTWMERGEQVVLETFYAALYRDLREQGLKLMPIQGHDPRVREYGRLRRDPVDIPADARRYRLAYNADAIRKHGSILGAQYACTGLKMPNQPDFSLPVPEAWKDAAWLKLQSATGWRWPTGKPLMVYRPTVLNNLFHCEPRLPDIASYAELYKSIRDDYFVVSVANLGDCGEQIVGDEMDADLKFHHGELPFQELVGLYASADLAFTCAGFAPVLAQAVGTPCVIVYGGHEGFGTTNSVGAHLAPTLAIEPINVCECHAGHYTRGPGGVGLVKPSKTHECDKTIDMPVAIRRLHSFVEQQHAYA
jgi:hypothetical protein